VIAAWPSFALIGACELLIREPAAARAADAAAARTPDRVSSRAAGCVLRALVTPVLPKFAVMKSAQQMRVVIQPVGGSQHLLKVRAVIARRAVPPDLAAGRHPWTVKEQRT
jgi:hypothetical protein